MVGYEMSNNEHPNCPRCGELGSDVSNNGIKLLIMRYCKNCGELYYPGKRPGEE